MTSTSGPRPVEITELLNQIRRLKWSRLDYEHDPDCIGDGSREDRLRLRLLKKKSRVQALQDRLTEVTNERSLAEGKEPFPPLKQCGHYKEGTILCSIKVVGYKDSNEFYFHQNIITDKEKSIMLATRSILYYRSKQAMYASNPHNAELKQQKLYFDGTIMHRCRIEDLYCIPADGRLEAKTMISLHDQLQKTKLVDHASIYDYPPSIRHLKEVEPEIQPARLYLGPTIPELYKSARVEEFIKEHVVGCKKLDCYDIKILDYRNDIFYVDLISPHNKEESLSSLVLQNFSEFKRFLGPDRWFHLWTFDPVGKPKITKRITNVRKRYKGSRDRTFPRPITPETHPSPAPEPCSLAYFVAQTEAATNTNDCSTPFIKKRLFKVLVIDWNDLDHIYIRPKELVRETHAQFMEALNSLQCIKEADVVHRLEREPFRIGEYVLYRNHNEQPGLGKWFRGVVVLVSYYDEYTLAANNLTDESLEDHAKLTTLTGNGTLDPFDLLYIVRSIDYGFYNRSSQGNMHHVPDLKEFQSIGTYGLRCRLFGVHNLPHEKLENLAGEAKLFRHTCASEFINSYIRNKIMPHFEVLFRTNLRSIDPQRSFDMVFDISLFYRHIPTSELFIPPIKIPFECLNWLLVDKGVACDSRLEKGDWTVSSNIMLDAGIVNMLVEHGMF